MSYCDKFFFLGEVMQILFQQMPLLEKCNLKVELGINYQGYYKVLRGFRE
jgi:hypothetical protein